MPMTRLPLQAPQNIQGVMTDFSMHFALFLSPLFLYAFFLPAPHAHGEKHYHTVSCLLEACFILIHLSKCQLVVSACLHIYMSSSCYMMGIVYEWLKATALYERNRTKKKL